MAIDYKCTSCSVKEVKLWRDSNTFRDHLSLYCINCAIKNQDKPGLDASADQIGNLVPAVPTVENDTFWGYTSVPEDRCVWWYNLPIALPRSMTPELHAYSVLRRFKQKNIIHIEHGNGIKAVTLTALHLHSGKNLKERVTDILDALRAKDLIHIIGDRRDSPYLQRMLCQHRCETELAEYELRPSS